MFNKILKLGTGISSFALITLFSISNVNAQSACPGTIYSSVNNTNTYEYAVNDNCNSMYLNLNNDQYYIDRTNYINRISFDAHDFNSNYVYQIYAKGSNGIYYLVVGETDMGTRDNQNCSDYKNHQQPAYGVNKCFVSQSFNINQQTDSLLIKVYTMSGKTPNYNHYAYIKNIRIEGYGNPYPTYTPTPYPTYYPTPYPTYYPTPYPTYYPTPIYSRPNLMVEDIQFSNENPDYYQKVDISATIRNKDGNDSARGFYIRMYRNNNEIANTYYNETLYSGSAFTWKVINNDLEVGNNNIRVIVDTDNRISETNENDNDRTETIYKQGYNSNPYPIEPYPVNPGNVLGDTTIINIIGDCNNINIPSDIYGNRYYSTIYMARCYGITQGYSDNTYRPSSNITRAEFVTMLMRAFPEYYKSNVYSSCGYFDDVNYYNLHWNSIQSAKCSGILRGYSDNTFRPNNYISYGEAASVIYNLLNNYGYNYNNIQMSYQPYFVDQNSPHYNGIYYLSNMNPYSSYPAYDYYYGNSVNDGNYADRGWIANSLVNARYYVN